MKLKYLGIILVFFMVIGMVSASNSSGLSNDEFKNITFYDNDTTVSVKNLDFTIPKGYGIIDKLNYSETDDDEITENYLFFVDENKTVMMVCVMSQEFGIYIDATCLSEDYAPAKIGNHEGYLTKVRDYYSFLYVDNDYAVILVADSLSSIEKMMGK